eukprot:CAMPEP_0196819336 /NCGR_PEP_ID=MMETSP1362-20130617/70106_1 /TAXON_ID=163516 /ORGANISM="Leptocylindrus danicus, Strain CCMP1856" /LENGTH=384 /DNA_ID=CAMNT_0042197789 /DNA_START=85 /DNA_END=1236 /DNA_ORIENTATION=+
MTDNSNNKPCISGIIFSRTVRSQFATFHIASENQEKSGNNKGGEHIVVRIQFAVDDHAQRTALRSWCRRCCNYGDLLQLKGQWTTSNSASQWKDKRFVVNVLSTEEADATVIVLEGRRWDMKQCQEWHHTYLKQSDDDDDNSGQIKQEKQRKRGVDKDVKTKEDNAVSCTLRHGSSMPKREQGEIVTKLLIEIVKKKLVKEDPSLANVSKDLHSQALKRLNEGSGVIDVAGGSGHVSMALGMAGIRATVVDPREAVGKLPGRDRKIWYRALKKTRGKNAGIQCLPCHNPTVVPYSTLRAWFGECPDGANSSHRHPDKEQIKVCSAEHDLVSRCSAIVALHPDEATDSIVNVAVQRRIPFVIVPCCVFARLFPNRRLLGFNEPVS